MIKLGEFQELEIKKKVDFGAYLGDEGEETVLIPAKQLPDEAAVGDRLRAFIYRDSKDRLIATTNEPAVTLGCVAVMRVKEVTAVGAFLDWGLEKDLLLPFKEQTRNVTEGEEVAAALYIDKSSRLCATMKIYDYLRPAENYKKNDEASGVVYELNPRYGAFVAVDLKYNGMIPQREIHQTLREGDNVSVRVTEVRDDGKLNLSLRKKAYLQISDDAETISDIICEMGGTLPYTDKASPEVIERDFGMSKAAFKRGIGKLLKERKIIIDDKTIRLV